MASEKRAFVTGGGGFVGGKLCEGLAAKGYSVTAFDVRYLETSTNDGIKRIKGDLCDAESVFSAMAAAEADVVFHIASYGMSGREQLNRKLIEAVNVGGTKHVIEGCIKCGVSRLIYTSTYNVIFVGEEIKNGDGTEPYPHSDKYVDHYSRTKAVAEREVIRANGTEVKGGGKLKTCSLRCAGIYGEGEQRHLPRIVSYIERGLFKVTYGAKDSLVEFLHADNFVQAHIRAAEVCLQPDSPVPGQCYCISDDQPVNNFEFFRPLVEGLGYTHPQLSVPISLVFMFAYMTELIHSVIGRYIYNFQPLLTRAEVQKTGVTHYFSMDRARADFGYKPEKKNMDGVVKWFCEQGHGKKVGRERKAGTGGSLWTVLIYLAIFMVVVSIVMSYLPTVA